MASDAAIKTAGWLVLILLIVAGLGTVLAYEQVPEGHEGVTERWGAVTGETLDPGAHFKTPIAEDVRHVEVRPRTYTMASASAEGQKNRDDAIHVQTVNGTSVDVDVTVRYRINEDQADEFVREWNDEGQMERRLIRPTVRSEMRDEAAHIPTTTIYTSDGRQRLQRAAVESLNEQFSGQPITLEAVQVRDVNLPDEYDAALDDKEVAKQRVEEEKYNVQAERERAQQRVEEAKGEAESVRERAQAYEEHPVILEVERIEALQDGSVFVVPEDQSTPVMIDGSQQNATASP